MFWYFPLRDQLSTLLCSKKYRQLLMHETRRAKRQGFMSDVYDTPRWNNVAGPPTRELTRIVYQFCVDGFPWSRRKHLVLYLLSSCLQTHLHTHKINFHTRAQTLNSFVHTCINIKLICTHTLTHTTHLHTHTNFART